MTKIVVYFETPTFSHAEVVAQFADEELYAVCLPALEKYASENGWVVTESVREDEQVSGEKLIQMLRSEYEANKELIQAELRAVRKGKL